MDLEAVPNVSFNGTVFTNNTALASEGAAELFHLQFQAIAVCPQLSSAAAVQAQQCTHQIWLMLLPCVVKAAGRSPA